LATIWTGTGGKGFWGFGGIGGEGGGGRRVRREQPAGASARAWMRGRRRWGFWLSSRRLRRAISWAKDVDLFGLLLEHLAKDFEFVAGGSV